MRLIHATLDGNTNQINYIEIHDAPTPSVYKGTVLVEVKASGISVTSSEVLSEVFKQRPQVQYPATCEIAGIVVEVGKNVTSLEPGSKVAGIVPLDSSHSGLAQYCLCSEYDLVKLSDEISFDTAAAGIGDGIKVYTALNYLGHLKPDEVLLVTDPLSSWGTLMVQLAKAWGAKVFGIMYDEGKERSQLEKLDLNYIAQCNNNEAITNGIMEESGGLGVNVIVDNGVRQFSSEEDCKLFTEERNFNLPHKHDLINCLAVGGRWVTSQHNLQMDPPHNEQLFLRCASIGFLFEHVWSLSGTHVGRLQHILKDVIDLLTTGVLKPNIIKTLQISDVLDHLHRAQIRNRGKTVVRI